MKKMFVLVAITVIGHLAFAQAPKETEINKTKPDTEHKKYHKGHRHEKMEMMKALNLTEAQKNQMKEMKMANKEKRTAILNNSSLTEDQKKDQLKELNKASAENMQSILTDEQKVKMKEAREKMKAERIKNGGRMHKKEEAKTTNDSPAKQ